LGKPISYYRTRVKNNFRCDNLLEICHVGSIAIKNIVAKPILDVAIVIKNLADLNIDGMMAVGYDYCSDRELAGRYLFVRRVNGDISTHNIHCYLPGNENYASVILFRNFLNANPKHAKNIMT
jgi:GrpB-like predicted nucleotidyltransferase (UPF0157 family)